MKKENKIILILSILGVLIVGTLLLCDSLTPSEYGELTINPFETDWALMSIDNIDVNALIHTILSALLGFLLTIICVEKLLKLSRDREQQYKRDLQFKNISKIIRVPLLRYHKASLSITYGIGNIPADEKVHVPIDPNSLVHVFEMQAYSNEPLFQTNIDFYSSSIDNLMICITNILLNVDLTDNEELSELLSNYVKDISAYNPCSQIIAMKFQVAAGEKISDYVTREISKVDFSKIHGANVFSPFMTLKGVLEYHEEFLKKLYELAPSFRYDYKEDEKK